jgi:hypothetical protein
VTLNANGSFTYTPKPDFSGTDAFTYKVTDGAASSNIVTVAININAVNDAPVNGVPVGQETPRNIPLIFWASSNGISVSDVDASTVQVRLTATNGTATVLFQGGLTFSVGDGFLDTTMTFTGTIANINAALGYVTFWPSSDFVGTGRLDIVTSDLGATGGGGTMTDSDSVTINVTSLGIFSDHVNIVAPSMPVAPGTGSSYSWPADYTVAASGWGIWDDYDGFRFVYRQMTGDVSLTARVQAETVTTGPHTDVSKAGVMFRQGLTERTMDAMMGITKAKGSEFLYRAADATGLPNSNCVTPWISSCTASASGTDSLAPPYWVRITRRGNQIMGETSPNGTTWTQRGTTQTIAMGSTIYVGLAASAVYQLDTAVMQGSKINTADFDNVAISTPPTALGDSYSVNANATLTIPAGTGVLANDSDPEGNGLVANVASSTAGLTLNQDGSFTYVPPANFFGTASFTYMANDGVFNSAAATVTIRVDPVNTTPSFTKGADQSIGSNLGPQTVAGWATAISQGGADTGQLVDFVVTNSNSALFSVQPAVSAAGILTYASATNVSGIATVSVTIHDNGGTTNGAIDTSAAQAFTIFVNNPPVVTASGGTLAYTENATTVLDPGLTVTDTDGPNLASANITMTGAYANGQDTLAFVNQNGITGTWTPATGVLALSGASTVANYQAAVRSITYTNTSDNPSTATRTVTFDAFDGLLTSNTSSRTITITAVGDAPVITTSVGPLAYIENAVPALDAGITVTDPDSANLTSLTVTITAYIVGQDTLAFVDQNGITGVWNPATGVLSLSGTSTAANYQIALRTITYTNSSDAPNTTARSVTFVGSDGALTSNAATRAIAITAVNDAPVNSVPAGQSTPRNTTKVFSSGNGNLISISDLDAAASTVRVQLVSASGATTLSALSGLTFTAGDGTADATMTFTGTMASVNSALAGLSFIPTTNFNGAANLQIVTNDLGNTGTGGAFSDTDNIAIIVNNAPVVTTTVTTLTYLENAAATVIDSLITVADTGSTNLTSARVTVATNYVNGQDILAFTNQLGITGTWTAATGILSLSGTTTPVNYQTALRAVTYRNTSDSPTTTRTVTFVANDGFIDSNTASKTITVTAVNDAPVVGGTTGSLAYVENGTTVLVPLITVTDADAANMSSATVTMTSPSYVNAQDTLAFVNQNGITGTWTPAALTGTLTLSGTATVADYQTALRSITYNNSSDTPTTTTRTVTFVVNDGIANSNTATRTITLAAVNDAPVNGVPGTQTTPKNVSLVFLASTSNLISIGDADAAASLVQVQLVATSGTSTLFRTTGLAFTVGNGTNNTTMTFTGTIANVNAALAGMRFNPTAGFVGTGTLRIVTNDQGNTGSGGAKTDSDTVQIFVT